MIWISVMAGAAILVAFLINLRCKKNSCSRPTYFLDSRTFFTDCTCSIGRAYRLIFDYKLEYCSFWNFGVFRDSVRLSFNDRAD